MGDLGNESGWVRGMAGTEFALWFKVCMCMCLCVQALGRLLGHPVTLLWWKSFSWPTPAHASVSKKENKKKTECAHAVQTDAQCHFQIVFTCVSGGVSGLVSVCKWMCTAYLCVRVVPSHCALSICVCVWVFCSKQMFFPVCVYELNQINTSRCSESGQGG